MAEKRSVYTQTRVKRSAHPTCFVYGWICFQIDCIALLCSHKWLGFACKFEAACCRELGTHYIHTHMCRPPSVWGGDWVIGKLRAENDAQKKRRSRAIKIVAAWCCPTTMRAQTEGFAYFCLTGWFVHTQRSIRFVFYAICAVAGAVGIIAHLK